MLSAIPQTTSSIVGACGCQPRQALWQAALQGEPRVWGPPWHDSPLFSCPYLSCSSQQRRRKSTTGTSIPRRQTGRKPSGGGRRTRTPRPRSSISAPRRCGSSTTAFIWHLSATTLSVIWCLRRIPGREDATAFAFDFDTSRKEYRREKESCKSSWINSHSCPEPDQELSYRYIFSTGNRQLLAPDGTRTDPGNKRQLKHLRDPSGNLIEASRLKYTCDELPPASFVQGGQGAATRCAAFRCGPGAAAEQQWQAQSHKYLPPNP